MIYLIRHGEIEKKYLGRYIGSTDVGLSRVGKKQAKNISNFFKNIPLDVIYVSHLKRSQQTAKPIAQIQKREVMQDKRIAEIDLGAWEGKTGKQVKKMIPQDIACEKVTSGGELYADFSKRVRNFTDEIKNLYENKSILVVTHKGVIREMYKYLLADEDLIVDQEYGAINQFAIHGKQVTENIRNKIV